MKKKDLIARIIEHVKEMYVEDDISCDLIYKMSDKKYLVNLSQCGNFIVLTAFVRLDDSIATILLCHININAFTWLQHPCKTRKEAFALHARVAKYIQRNNTAPSSIIAIHDADNDAGII